MTIKKELLLTDDVHLVYVLKSGIQVTCGVTTRSAAMKQIRDWWLFRQDAMEGKPSAVHFMKKGTFAGANNGPDQKPLADHYAFAWSEIVGMHIQECPSSEEKDLEYERVLLQREVNQALKAQADMIRRQIDHCEKHEAADHLYDQPSNDDPEEEGDPDENSEDPDHPSDFGQPSSN